MLDIKRIRQNPNEITALLQKRGCAFNADEFLQFDDQKRALLALSEEKKNQRNALSKQIGMARKNGAAQSEIDRLAEETRAIGTEIEKIDAELQQIDHSMQNALLSLPNLPHPDVPDESCAEAGSHGTPRVFVWEPKTHQEIGSDLHIVDWTGNALEAPVYYGTGAKLKRALVCFVLDQLGQNGFSEVLSSGWKDDASLLSLCSDRIADASALPALYSTCTAKAIEANAVVLPEQTDETYQKLISAVVDILNQLSLPCRRVNTCAQKLAFSAARSCGIEVWMPSFNQYRPVASLSDCTDFDARRNSIRFRIAKGEKPRLAYTLHGCMMDIGVAIAAILENNQNEDGTVTVPEMLVPYMNTALIR